MNICLEAFATTIFSKILSKLKLGTESVRETLEHHVTLTRHPARDDFIAIGRIFSGGASLKREIVKRFIAQRIYLKKTPWP